MPTSEVRAFRDAAWSDADRLDVLNIQWQDVVREAAQRRYQAAVREALTETQAADVLVDPAATWLWRSLREAEAAGLDEPATLRRVVASGPLEDAESVAKVVDWRIRQQIIGMPALAARPWLAQVPDTGDAGTDRYAREPAAAMDDRQRWLGEHAAEHPPAWAQALGPVPSTPGPGRMGATHRSGRRVPGVVGLHPSVRADRLPPRPALTGSPRFVASRRSECPPAVHRSHASLDLGDPAF